jgi:hypothetical protein
MLPLRIPLAILCILTASASAARPVVSWFQLPARGGPAPEALTSVPGVQQERVGPTSSLLQIPSNVDDFAGTNVPKYLLPNGVEMQFSGEFRPGERVTCISHCSAIRPR